MESSWLQKHVKLKSKCFELCPPWLAASKVISKKYSPQRSRRDKIARQQFNFRSVLVKVVYISWPQSGEVNIHHESPPFQWIFVNHIFLRRQKSYWWLVWGCTHTKRGTFLQQELLEWDLTPLSWGANNSPWSTLNYGKHVTGKW